MEDLAGEREAKMNRNELQKEYYLKNKDKYKEWNKQWRLNNKELKKEYDKKWYQKNRELSIERAVEWNKNNKEKYDESVKKRLNTEKGFMKAMWQDIKNSGKHNSFKDFEDFFDHWLKQKKIHGMTCPATGVEMTTKKLFNKGKRCQTNISKDRILNSMGYSHQNLIFTCWNYNAAKNAVTPKMAKAYLKIVKERYSTDEIE